LGENVTTRGVDLLGLPTGTRLRLGDEVVVTVTGLRNPCSQIDDFQRGMLKAVMYRDADGEIVRKAGVMATVDVGGVVRPGDAITTELPAGPHRPRNPVEWCASGLRRARGQPTTSGRRPGVSQAAQGVAGAVAGRRRHTGSAALALDPQQHVLPRRDHRVVLPALPPAVGSRDLGDLAGVVLVLLRPGLAVRRGARRAPRAGLLVGLGQRARPVLLAP